MGDNKRPDAKGYEVVTVPACQDTAKQEEARGNWGSQMDFILSCIGYAVGLGNIWRFPYLCYRNGGGVFLIPYVIMLIFAGMPLFLLESAFAQYANEGPVTIWKSVPLFTGIGWAMAIISGLVAIYYNIIMAWTVFYLFKSMTFKVPWQSCNNWWNSDACGYSIANGTVANGTYYNQSMAKSLGLNVSLPSLTMPAEEYWNDFVLQISGGIDKPGPVRWQLALCLLLSWTVVFLCICKGVKSSGKVVYFTATFPYVVLTILLLRGVTLPGSSVGISYYLSADWKKLGHAQVWNDAATQIFYSLGPAWGGLLTFSSYNRFDNNCFRDALIIPLINCGTSFYAGFAVFATLGFMSHKTGLPIEDVAVQGPGLVFITYPEAIAHMPFAPLWAILFFFMLFLVGLDTQFGMVETVISAVVDTFPVLRPRKTLFSFGVCFMCFVLGLPIVTEGGIYIFELINWYSAWISLMLVGMMECIVVAWFYGVRRFLEDIKAMLGELPVIWPFYMACWCVITPGIIMFIIIFSLVDYSPVHYGSYVYPVWCEVIGWMMALVSVAMIPTFMVVEYILHAEGDTPWEKIKFLLQPAADWVPANQKQGHCAYQMKPIDSHLNGEAKPIDAV